MITLTTQLARSALTVASWAALLVLIIALTQIISNPLLGATAIFGVIFGIASYGSGHLAATADAPDVTDYTEGSDAHPEVPT